MDDTNTNGQQDEQNTAPTEAQNETGATTEATPATPEATPAEGDTTSA